MRVFFVARQPADERGPETVREAGLAVEPIAGPPALAAALLALERRLAAAGNAAVVTGDDSDLSLAAALVAAKLELPLAASRAALAPASRNARLLGQLAEATLGDDASEIAAWVRAAEPGSGEAPG